MHPNKNTKFSPPISFNPNTASHSDTGIALEKIRVKTPNFTTAQQQQQKQHKSKHHMCIST